MTFPYMYIFYFVHIYASSDSINHFPLPQVLFISPTGLFLI